MTAEPDEVEPVADRELLARPQLDAVAGPGDPFAVGLVRQDPRVEPLGQVGHPV